MSLILVALVTKDQKRLEITMANIVAFNASNSRNALGRKVKDDTSAKLNYFFSFLLEHDYWLKECTINKIKNHIKSSCDSC